MGQNELNEVDDQRQILALIRQMLDFMKQDHELLSVLWKSHYGLVSALRVEYGLEPLSEPPEQPDAESLARIEAGRVELERMFGDGRIHGQQSDEGGGE